jgi:WD40 repeat protein
MRPLRWTLASIAIAVLACPLLAQQNCPPPPAIQAVSRDLNMFSDQQEVDLGDAMAENLGRRYPVIDDNALNSYLRALGQRVVQHLPPNNLNFRFYLIDLPEVNAFSIAGGRVYVSRKMVAMAQTDDELAGVLAHELGHIVTHQTAIFMTRRFREVLNVDQGGDRDDIFKKFHEYLENAARKPPRGGDEEKAQYVADQVALYAMARAGYAPHAYVDLWDRFQQTHGKTGSWFSDFLGSTKPSERRLREMLKNVSALPAGCADLPPSGRSVEFAKWQSAVIANDIAHQEALPGLVFKQTLALPLRPDISYLRFSPDGRFILAQDEAGIHVVTRDPFQVAFYIPALDANDAAFTSDSRSITFYNRSLRVETWSIPDQKRTAVHELTLAQTCLQTTLSADGTVLACYDSDFTLSLLDVATSAPIATKKKFCGLEMRDPFVFLLFWLAAAEAGKAEFIHIGFSPDSHFFLGGCRMEHFAFDLTAHRDASLPGSIKDITRGPFAFIGTDRVVGIDPDSQSKSPLLRFPSGERLDRVPLSMALERLEGPGHGDYLIVGPMHEYPVGILDLKAKNIPVAVKQPAIDIYDGVMVHEQISGELALNEFASKKLLATVSLPQARLGPLQAAAVSPDFSWMAISNRTRGAVWDLTRNIRTVHLRSFHGAWYGDDETFYLDFAKYQDKERQIGHVFPSRGDGTPGYVIGQVQAIQRGPYLIITTPWKKGFARSTDAADVEFRDVRDGKVVWSRHFARETPEITLGDGNTVLLSWPLVRSGGWDALQNYPDVKARAQREDYFCELVDIRRNTDVGKLLIKTNHGSLRVNHVDRDGDWVVASVGENEVLTFSLVSGDEKGRFFGFFPVTSAKADFLAVESNPNTLMIYDLASTRLRQKYTFPDPISLKGFSGDGKRLFVLTNSQTAYVLDVSSLPQ